MSSKNSLKDRPQINPLFFVTQPFIEIWWGLKKKALPLPLCLFIGGLSWVLVALRFDLELFRYLGVEGIYPYKPLFYWSWFLFCGLTGFLFWGFLQTVLMYQLRRKLDEALINAGLINRLGQTPRFVNDHPLDLMTRTLQVSSSSFPVKQFEKAKDHLEAGLQVYIDQISERRQRGLVEIQYSPYPMPEIVKFENIGKFSGFSFFIGKSRSSKFKATLKNIPHLLVAGSTGGGKSTFLRSLITTIIVNNNKRVECMLIDLKGGLEFQLFENIPNVQIVSELSGAVSRLEVVKLELDKRMALLKAHECKDIDAYTKKRSKVANSGESTEKMPALKRHLIVVDEAAEMFLAGAKGDIQKTQKGRAAMSSIARLGRAVGVHLCVATQRPDTKSLDPQVKANLIGVLCFQMLNDASSITVLGDGRASDLPSVPGRAIWKAGTLMKEVQTPFMTTEEAEEHLRPFRVGDSEAQVARKSKIEPKNEPLAKSEPLIVHEED